MKKILAVVLAVLTICFAFVGCSGNKEAEEKKTLTMATNAEFPPYEYFENNELKMKNKYSTLKGEYTSQIFFGEGLSVKTHYENYIRVRDIYYKGNAVIRIKNYEKQNNSTESKVDKSGI